MRRNVMLSLNELFFLKGLEKGLVSNVCWVSG